MGGRGCALIPISQMGKLRHARTESLVQKLVAKQGHQAKHQSILLIVHPLCPVRDQPEHSNLNLEWGVQCTTGLILFPLKSRGKYPLTSVLQDCQLHPPPSARVFNKPDHGVLLSQRRRGLGTAGCIASLPASANKSLLSKVLCSKGAWIQRPCDPEKKAAGRCSPHLSARPPPAHSTGNRSLSACFLQ